MNDNQITIRPLTFGDDFWNPLEEYADTCTWRAGKFLAQSMRANGFSDCDRVFIALDGANIAGFCTLVKNDCIPDVSYTPYISSVFVGEKYRGNRLSQKLIDFVLGYAKGLGFDKAYLVSDHINLYEKYGFVKVDEKPAPWNPTVMETIFMHET